MFNFLWRLFFDETGAVTISYSFSPNTLIASAEVNTNNTELLAGINAVATGQIVDDAVTAIKLNIDVVRADYGLLQHTTGALQVDPSDTNPCLEITDGGVRVKVDDSSIERAAGGLQVKALGVTSGMLVADLVFGTFPLSPSAAPDADYELSNKKYVDNQITANLGVVQVVNVMSGAVATGIKGIPDDDTIPQITEGDEYMTLAITPKNATNKLFIQVVWNGSVDANSNPVMALFQDATVNALATVVHRFPQVTTLEQMVINYYMVAGTTSATTFRVRVGTLAGTITFNGVSAARKYGGVMASSIVITEIAA